MDRIERNAAGFVLFVFSLLFFFISYLHTGVAQNSTSFAVIWVFLFAIISGGILSNILTTVEIFCSVLLFTICFASGRIFFLDSIGIYDLRVIVAFFFSLLFVSGVINHRVKLDKKTTDDEADADAEIQIGPTEGESAS